MHAIGTKKIMLSDSLISKHEEMACNNFVADAA